MTRTPLPGTRFLREVWTACEDYRGWSVDPILMPALSLAGNMSLSIAELDESGRPEVICIGYEVSLERRKIYVSIADSRAEKLGQLRVIDESREDYLYPKESFVTAQLPRRDTGEVQG